MSSQQTESPPTKVTFVVPSYLGLRMWLWRLTRIHRPKMVTYIAEGVEWSEPREGDDGDVTLDFTCQNLRRGP